MLYERPKFLKDRLQNVQNSAARLVSKESLVVPSSNLIKKGGRSFSHAGHKLWNELPDNIRDSNDLTTFESKSRTILFRTT